MEQTKYKRIVCTENKVPKQQPTILIAATIGKGKEYTLPYLRGAVIRASVASDVLYAFDGIEYPWDSGLASNEFDLYVPPFDDDEGDEFYYYKKIGWVREQVRQYFLKGKWDYLYFHDCDMLPPDGIVGRLLQHKRHITTGLYVHRSSIEPIFSAVTLLPLLSDSLDPFNYDLIQMSPFCEDLEVKAFGMGCMLISREAMEKVSFADIQYSHTGATGEDYGWCYAAHDAGFGRVLVDASEICWHCDDLGWAVRPVFGEQTNCGMYIGNQHEVGNAYGRWQHGVIRTGLEKWQMDSLGAEFLRGRGAMVSVERQRVEDILGAR